MDQITEPAPAKINLALHLRRKRPDGYHDLETLFAFARDGDVVTVTPAKLDALAITGPFADALQPTSTPAKAGAQDRAASKNVPSHDIRGNWTPVLAGEDQNLVVQATVAFRAAFGCPPVAIALEKNLPIAAGIGGGSADAAAALRALARLTGTDPADHRLFAIASGLGADVPACLLGRPSFATGRGDDLAPLPPLGDLPLLLVNPRVPMPTGAMFAAWDRIDRGPLATAGTTLDRARAGRNDFTAPAVTLAPVVGEVLDLLDAAPGCTLLRLSGSGATCFGLFDDIAGRDAAAAVAGGRGWWVLPTLAT